MKAWFKHILFAVIICRRRLSMQLRPVITMWPQIKKVSALLEGAIDHWLSYACGMLCFKTNAPAGTDVKVLLQKCLHSILGSALPYKETGDAEERALANTVTAGGLLLKYLTGKLQNAPGPAVSHFALQT